MAESYDRNRRRRRRDRNDYPRYSDDVSPTPSKPPVTILGLAKPNKASTARENEDTNIREDDSHSIYQSQPNDPLSQNTSTIHEGTDSSKPRITLAKSVTEEQEWHGAISSHHSQTDEASHNAIDETASTLSPHLKRHVPTSVGGSMISGVIDQGAQTQSKLAPPLERQAKIKLIDEHFQWCDAGLDLMLDQTDFVVIGIVGLQGSGKSTLLSMLTGNTHQDAYRNYFFFPQTKEAKEDCLFQTSGVDMFVTSERVILLDTQPLLSAAMMDCLMRYERKFPTEYTSLQNFIEMQSMQLLTFLLSVCNIVLVADDWFIDVGFLRFLQDAEMLKPSTQLPSSQSCDSSSSKDDCNDFYPTVIFVHNKASKEDFNPETYQSMQLVLHKMLLSSKLKFRNNISMTKSSYGEPIIQPFPSSGTANSSIKDAQQVNLLLLPVMEFYKSEPDCLHTTLPEYRGYPSFNTLLSFFRAQVLSAPRSPLTPATLSEKNWYHFAARMWESVKKSSLLAEYNRLLSSTG